MNELNFYINGTNTKQWGITFGEDTLAILLTPPSVKALVESESALEHGKRVYILVGPKISSREITITMFLEAQSYAEFRSRYNAFLAVITAGMITLTTDIEGGEVYRLYYQSCSQYNQCGNIAKFMLKFIEPNPKNREQ